MSAISKIFSVSLDMKAPTAQRNEWEVVEGDNGNIIAITLTDDGVPVDLTGCKVLAVFGLPTGVTVEQDTDEGSVTIGGDDNNVITIALKTGSFSPGKSSSGLMKCEIQVYSGVPQNTLITSAQFTFRCRRAIMNDDTIAATDEYPVLVELIEEVQQLIIDNQSDWAEADTTDPAYIKNKPATMPPSSHTHGKIDNDGRTSTTYSHDAGDWLMVADYSDSGRIMRTDITFGNATNKWLRNDGSWTAPAPADVGTMRVYTSVTDLGLTEGSATIAGIWAAMPNNSLLMVNASQLASAERPPSGTSGDIEIFRIWDSLGRILSYGKLTSGADYRMFLNSSNIPDGTWVRTTYVGTGTFAQNSSYTTSANTNMNVSQNGNIVSVYGDIYPTVEIPAWANIGTVTPAPTWPQLVLICPSYASVGYDVCPALLYIDGHLDTLYKSVKPNIKWYIQATYFV